MQWWLRLWPERNPEAPATPLERLQERASAYLDGELSAGEREAFEAELASSEAAREQLDGLRQVQTALAAIGTIGGMRVPRSFALLAPPAPAHAGPRRLEWATRAGTGIAALLFVVALTDGGSAGDTPVTFQASRESASGAASRAAHPSTRQAAPQEKSGGIPAGAAGGVTTDLAAPTSTATPGALARASQPPVTDAPPTAPSHAPAVPATAPAATASATPPANASGAAAAPTSTPVPPPTAGFSDAPRPQPAEAAAPSTPRTTDPAPASSPIVSAPPMVTPAAANEAAKDVVTPTPVDEHTTTTPQRTNNVAIVLWALTLFLAITSVAQFAARRAASRPW